MNGELVYAGRVGTGFTDDFLRELGDLLAPITRPEATCRGPVIEGLTTDTIPEIKTTTWVEPMYVCEVRFREWTPDGLLRHAT